MTPISSHDHMTLGDHQDHELQLFKEKIQTSSSTSHLISHVLANPFQDQGSCSPREALQLKYMQEETNFGSEGGSSHDQGLKLCLWKNKNGQKNKSHDHHHQIPTKWLPSKLRLVRRMMNSDWTVMETSSNPPIGIEDQRNRGSSSPLEATGNSSNSSSSSPIRVCSDCNTTKTPLWRSGPRGPKSLCNACGIRQRKARRAMAAAAAAANGTPLAAAADQSRITHLKPNKVLQKDKRLKINNTQIAPCKKRSKPGNDNNGSKKQLCFEDFLISLSKNLAFQQVFPQDEKEAAILLMALSCDLVHG